MHITYTMIAKCSQSGTRENRGCPATRHRTSWAQRETELGDNARNRELHPASANSGLTLIELLVVLGVLALLMALLFPAAARARERADAARCLNNGRQLALSWTMYAEDWEDRLVSNVDGLFGGFTNWVAGNMMHPADKEDSALLVGSRSLFSPYVREPSIYRCPGDESQNVRSVAMNCRMNPVRHLGGPARWIGGSGAKFKTFRKLSSIEKPAEVFVILDESDVTINDGYFAVDLSNTGNNSGVGSARPFYLIDSPGVFHSEGSTVSFADGHVILKKWVEASTRTDISPKRHLPAPNEDAAWLQAHSSYE